MLYIGQISKMISSFNSPIQYRLPIGNKMIELNNLIGHDITISFQGDVYCIECNTKIKKTFMQGLCYSCFINSPMASECIFRPHLCRAHEGIARDMKWANKHCLKDHFVYLSLTSNLKVGVTRKSQIPTRWIDQGAHCAIKFSKTPNRYLAGCIELELAQYVSDRTQWRKMLRGDYENINLILKKEELYNKLSPDLKQYTDHQNDIIKIKYPLSKNLLKIQSINLEKTPKIDGQLTGIKGQYLIIDNTRVFNVRKYTGYILEIYFSDLGYNN